MFDYIKVAAAVPEVYVADVAQNTIEIKKKISEASAMGANIIAFPELAVTGSTCGDLFFQKPLIMAAAAAISEIAEFTKKYESVVIFGAPINIDNRLYNCAVVAKGGKIFAIAVKTNISNFEKRIFATADMLDRECVMSREIFSDLKQNYEIYIGNDLIIDLNSNVKFGVEIGEDMNMPLAPSTALAMAGAEIILNISATAEVISKREYIENFAKIQSARNMCAYVYVSSGAGESTTDFVFSGQTVIAENGKILRENKQVAASDYIVVSDIDTGKIKSDRIRQTDMFRELIPCRTINIDGSIESDGFDYTVNKHPFIPSDEKSRICRCQNVFEMQVAALKKRLKAAGAKPVIGVSGGLDSTLALLVCAETVKRLEKPMSEVVGVTMPCFGTSDRTYHNAVRLMQSLGITQYTVPIKDACIQHYKDIGHDINIHDVTYENAQARERTQVLMDISNRVGGIVVGTGDLSELALGWCTYNGDQMSMYGVNAGVPKTLIKWIIAAVAENGTFEKSADILKSIIDTPISPELLPPDKDGKISQKTEDVVGPYELHDFFIYYMLRYGFSPAKIYYMAKRAFDGEYDNQTILKWLKVFSKRFFTQQFKRSCMPDGVKIGSVGLSPRGDMHMPSDASSAVWMRELELL